MRENNFDNKSLNKIITGKVIKLFPTYILVEFNEKIGICHIKNISDYHVNNINDFFQIGKEYHFLLIDCKDNKFHLSYKALNPKLLKNHRKIIPTFSDFDNIKKYVDELIDNK